MLFCQTLILLFATVTSATISARQSGQPDGVAVTQVSNSGSGCRDSLNYSITPDNSIVLSHFDDFYVSTGPSISPAERSKNCALHASFTYPAGWQFMLIQSTYSGYARLDPGVGGHFYTQYFVSSNAANTFSAQTDISGDAFVGGASYTLDQTAINPVDLWSACGQSDIANFNNRLALETSGTSDPNASGQLSGNGAQNQTFSLVWRQC